LGSFRQIRARRSHVTGDWVRSANFAPVTVPDLDEVHLERPERLVALGPRLPLISVELQQVRQACEESLGGQGRLRRRLVREGRLDVFGREAKGRGLSRAHLAQLRLRHGGGTSVRGGGGLAVAEPERPRFDDRELRGIGFDRPIQPVP
jgi:hypothetical protein